MYITFNKILAVGTTIQWDELIFSCSKMDIFSACPNEEVLSNDTLLFRPTLAPGERFGDNRWPIDVRVISSSILGGTAIGPVTTFNLYEKC
jgi:hypothetical protein